MLRKGFALFELLPLVAVLGILGAVVVPAFLDALERSCQKRTMSDIRSMGGAAVSFSREYDGFPSNRYSGDPAVAWPMAFDANGSPAIVPDFIQAVPAADGWSRPYHYDAGPDEAYINERLGDVTAKHFVVYSYGSDGFDGGGDPSASSAASIAACWCAHPPVSCGTLETHCYQTDIVWGDGAFLQAPSGRQTSRCEW